jgi:hypothetical protein
MKRDRTDIQLVKQKSLNRPALQSKLNREFHSFEENENEFEIEENELVISRCNPCLILLRNGEK